MYTAQPWENIYQQIVCKNAKSTSKNNRGLALSRAARPPGKYRTNIGKLNKVLIPNMPEHYRGLQLHGLHTCEVQTFFLSVYILSHSSVGQLPAPSLP